MSIVSECIVEDRGLYEVASLPLVGTHRDRRLAPNIEQGGHVHLNILEPGARAGNHYHEHVEEFFINPGPATLVLHLRDTQSGNVQSVVLPAASTAEVRAFRAKLGVTHMVENPNGYQAALIIVVDRDDPADVVPAEVYPRSELRRSGAVDKVGAASAEELRSSGTTRRSHREPRL